MLGKLVTYQKRLVTKRKGLVGQAPVFWSFVPLIYH